MMTEQKHDVIIRSIRPDDLEKIAALSLKSFGPAMALQYEHFKSQLEIFPEGQVCVEYDGKIVGCAISLIIDIADYGHAHTYEQISDEGFIRNHKPDGKNLYGIEVGVDPDYRNLKLGKLLYDARRKICKDLHLKSILIGGRMPNYHLHADHMTALEYAEKVVAGELYDPVATFQSKSGFHLLTVIPGYLPGDEESLEYASLMEWVNEGYEE
jgi:ribosomal protein S18 acetylase RimI-like enzyme